MLEQPRRYFPDLKYRAQKLFGWINSVILLRERKTHKHKQICGIVPGLVGAENLFMCVFFFRVIPDGGEKHINKIPPKIPGPSGENFVYVFFLYVFFLLTTARSPQKSPTGINSVSLALGGFLPEICSGWNKSGESNRPLTPIHVKKYRDTPPISMAYFCKCMPSLWQKVVYTPPICITIRLPFVSRYFCGSIRVRGRWDTPKQGKKYNKNWCGN